jgi:hypothetical protein
MAAAKPDAIFMHCLPSFHDLNTTSAKRVGARFSRDSMESIRRRVFRQAIRVFDERENRMHTIKKRYCSAYAVAFTYKTRNHQCRFSAFFCEIPSKSLQMLPSASSTYPTITAITPVAMDGTYGDHAKCGNHTDGQR